MRCNPTPHRESQILNVKPCDSQNMNALRCFRKISFPTVDSMAFWVEESIVGCRVVSVHSLRIFFCYYSKKIWLLTLVLSGLHVTLWGDFAFCIALCGLSRSDHMVHLWDIWKSREQVSSDRISTLCGTWHWSYLDRWSDMSRRGWQMIPLTGTQHCSVLVAFSIYQFWFMVGSP